MVDYLNASRFKKYTFVIVNRENDEIVYAGPLSDDVDKYFNSKDHKIRIYKDGEEIKGEVKKKIFGELRSLLVLNMYLEKEIPRSVFYDRSMFIIDGDKRILKELEKEVKKNKELIKDLNRLLILLRRKQFNLCLGDIVQGSEAHYRSMKVTKCFISRVISDLVSINRGLISILRRYYYKQDEE